MQQYETSALFRGMRTQTSEWVYGCLIIRKDKYYIATSDNLGFMVVDADGRASVRLIEVIPETVGGYSSMDDANDIKVFAGDIIENLPWPDGPFQNIYHIPVVFEQGAYFGGGLANIEANEFQYCRVIGNIHENPELLNNSEDE